MPQDIRPTSPHLSIYRPQISTVLSIMHRISGLALVAGSALMLAWLWSAAYAPAFYPKLHEVLGSPLGRICMMGWTLAFYYHLLSGIRHLFWDMGKGFALPTMEKTGWTVVILTLVLTALTWGYINRGGL